MKTNEIANVALNKALECKANTGDAQNDLKTRIAAFLHTISVEGQGQLSTREHNIFEGLADCLENGYLSDYASYSIKSI